MARVAQFGQQTIKEDHFVTRRHDLLAHDRRVGVGAGEEVWVVAALAQLHHERLELLPLRRFVLGVAVVMVMVMMMVGMILMVMMMVVVMVMVTV